MFVAEDSRLEEDSQCQVLLLLIKLIMVIHCHQIPLFRQKYEPKMNDFDVQKLPKKLHFWKKSYSLKLIFYLQGLKEAKKN